MSQPIWKSGSAASKPQLTLSKVRQRANQLLRALEIDGPPVPVEKVAAALNIEIIAEPFTGDISGALLQTKGRSIIGVNKLHPLTRQRFTIAHEIGHFLLHNFEGPHFDRRVLLRNAKSSLAIDPMEIEANRFAAELLMPKAFILKDLEALNIEELDDEKLSELAERYDVSIQACSVRLNSLGLLSI